MDRYTDDSHIHEGHRGRMRAKLFSYGQRIFDTYELLEMLLYHTIPYKDTNPVSKRLLLTFGGLDEVLSAGVDELTSVNGIGERTADFLTKVNSLSDIVGAEILCGEGRNFADYDLVGKYLVEYFSEHSENCVVGIFLDSSMRPLSIKKLFDLDYESGGVKPKAFIDEAVSSRATVVISAHNHPHGPFYPTQGDRATNSFITDSLSAAGFVHAEHYIVMGEYYAGIGSLRNFNMRLSQIPAVDRFFESKERSVSSPVKVSSLSTSADIDGEIMGGCNLYDLGFFADLIGYVCGGRSDEIAEMLLRKYHTIEGVLNASSRELISTVGDSLAFYLKLLAYVTSRRKTDRFTFGKQHSSVEIADYLKALFLGESVENTYLITFDKNDAVTGCHLLGEGTVSSSEILPRKAVETAISAKAVSVSIAHNHPGGNTNASSDDVNMTKYFVGIFKSCDIVLNEHYIIAGQLCDTVQFDAEDDR